MMMTTLLAMTAPGKPFGPRLEEGGAGEEGATDAAGAREQSEEARALDEKTRKTMPNVARYTMLILRMAPCARVFGSVTFCKDITQPNFDAAPPKKPQAQQ